MASETKDIYLIGNPSKDKGGRSPSFQGNHRFLRSLAEIYYHLQPEWPDLGDIYKPYKSGFTSSSGDWEPLEKTEKFLLLIFSSPIPVPGSWKALTEHFWSKLNEIPGCEQMDRRKSYDLQPLRSVKKKKRSDVPALKTVV